MHDHLRGLGRLVGVAAAAGVGLLLLTWRGEGRKAGAPRANLAQLLQREHGLRVLPDEVHISHGMPGSATQALAFRDVFLLGRAGGAAHRDVYWLRARFSPAGVPLEIAPPVNLSRTRGADERTIAVNGRYVAFAVPLQDRVATVVVVDVGGEDSSLTRGWNRLRRFTNAITNYQETGHLRGVGRHALEPRRPIRKIDLEWERGGLVLRAKSRKARFDPRRGRLTRGGDWLTHQPPAKSRPGLVNWMVNTVRNHPWVGPRRMAYLQYLVYSVRDFFRRRGGSADPRARSKDARPAHQLYRPPIFGVQAPGWPPPAIRPLARGGSANEGRWFAPGRQQIAYNPGAPVPVLETFVHPDPKRPYAVAGILIWDPRQVDIGMVAGTREPRSTTGLRGWGRIPRDRRIERLVAAFNGGFQTIHGEWGMQADERLIREPARWAATVMRMRDGALGIGTWESARRKVPAEIHSFRQNLVPLIEDGVINPYRNRYWGYAPRRATQRIYIVRSAICLTVEGFGAYLWGNALSLKTLGKAMSLARCQYGMQLDINSVNASVELYRVKKATPRAPARFPTGGVSSFGLIPGRSDLSFRARLLFPGMHRGSFPRYIRRDWRDFFFLYLRDILPGANLRPPISPALYREGEWRSPRHRQGPDPFPPRIAISFVRPDPRRPQARVQLVKLDPRRLAFLRRAGNSVGRMEASPRSLALLRFAGPVPPGLVVGGNTLVRPRAQGPALVVDRSHPEAAPRARFVPLLRADADTGRAALVVRGTAIAGTGRGRASMLGADRAGFVCYAVTDAAHAAALTLALRLAGCQGSVRLPDQPRHGPLLWVPGRAASSERLPGDRAPIGGPSLTIAIEWKAFAYARRVAVGMAARPRRVRMKPSQQVIDKIRERRRLRKLREQQGR